MFLSFYMPKVSEMLWNSPKNHFGSKGQEWMFHNFSTTNWCIMAQHKFCNFHVPKVSNMLQNTPKHHFGSNAVDWMLQNFATPK
jgi:hypothetical protein